jgi:hypothetical protein
MVAFTDQAFRWLSSVASNISKCDLVFATWKRNYSTSSGIFNFWLEILHTRISDSQYISKYRKSYFVTGWKESLQAQFPIFA